VTGLAETLTIQGELEELQRCSDWVAEVSERLDLPDKLTFILDLCFEEALSNVILYGLRDTPPPDRQILIQMAKAGAALHVVIEDSGTAFDPTAAPDHEHPSDLDHAKIGGLGILLLRKFTQGMSYERLSGRNRLALEFNLAGE